MQVEELETKISSLLSGKMDMVFQVKVSRFGRFRRWHLSFCSLLDERRSGRRICWKNGGPSRNIQVSQKHLYRPIVIWVDTMSEKEHTGFKYIENKNTIHRLRDVGSTIDHRNRTRKVQTSTKIKSNRLWRTILTNSHPEKTLGSVTFQSRCGWSVQERFEQQMKTGK